MVQLVSSRIIEHMAMTPTSYFEPNAILERLIVGMRRVLGSHLLGVYLYGSAVTGDFDPRLSDLDVLAVVDEDVDDVAFGALHALHDEIARAFPAWEGRVETQYVAAPALQTFKTQRHPMVAISPGEPFHRTEGGRDWLVNWYMVREQGRALWGPPPDTLIAPISRQEFVDVVREHVRWWVERVEEAEPRRPALAYIILTLCRALYTITHGEQTSKRRAALWTQEQLPEWASLIGRALDWRERWREENEVIDEAAYQETGRFVGVICGRIEGTD
jgi:hypothetical protein